MFCLASATENHHVPKMAPLCMVRRPPLLSLLAFLLFLLFVIANATSQFVYDSLTLLRIRDSVNYFPVQAGNGHSNTPPPHLASVPAYLWRPVYALPRNKKHRRRRGKRGGIHVKFRAYLASRSVDCPGDSRGSLPVDLGIFYLRRSLDYRYCWLHPVLTLVPGPRFRVAGLSGSRDGAAWRAISAHSCVLLRRRRPVRSQMAVYAQHCSTPGHSQIRPSL